MLDPHMHQQVSLRAIPAQSITCAIILFHSTFLQDCQNARGYTVWLIDTHNFKDECCHDDGATFGGLLFRDGCCLSVDLQDIGYVFDYVLA